MENIDKQNEPYQIAGLTEWNRFKEKVNGEWSLVYYIRWTRFNGGIRDGINYLLSISDDELDLIRIEYILSGQKRV
jgi:hypothetical protein